MDEDHTVALLDLGNGKVIATAKGTKKVITKIVWTSATTFVTCGISHFKTWSTDKGLTPGR
jgi:preprotein translocase subunit SecG